MFGATLAVAWFGHLSNEHNDDRWLAGGALAVLAAYFIAATFLPHGYSLLIR